MPMNVGSRAKSVREIDRGEPALPIVTMQNPRAKDAAHHFERRARQHRKADGIVRKVARGVAVKAVAVVERRAVGKIIRCAGLDAVERYLVGGSSQPNGKVAGALGWIDRDAAIARKQDRRLHAERSQRGGKGTQDIGQAPGFGKGRRLGGDHQDFGHEK